MKQSQASRSGNEKFPHRTQKQPLKVCPALVSVFYEAASPPRINKRAAVFHRRKAVLVERAMDVNGAAKVDCPNCQRQFRILESMTLLDGALLLCLGCMEVFPVPESAKEKKGGSNGTNNWFPGMLWDQRIA